MRRKWKFCVRSVNDSVFNMLSLATFAYRISLRTMTSFPSHDTSGASVRLYPFVEGTVFCVFQYGLESHVFALGYILDVEVGSGSFGRYLFLLSWLALCPYELRSASSGPFIRLLGRAPPAK